MQSSIASQKRGIPLIENYKRAGLALGHGVVFTQRHSYSSYYSCCCCCCHNCSQMHRKHSSSSSRNNSSSSSSQICSCNVSGLYYIVRTSGWHADRVTSARRHVCSAATVVRRLDGPGTSQPTLTSPAGLLAGSYTGLSYRREPLLAR
jgi:hypothetical protein